MMELIAQLEGAFRALTFQTGSVGTDDLLTCTLRFSIRLRATRTKYGAHSNEDRQVSKRSILLY